MPIHCDLCGVELTRSNHCVVNQRDVCPDCVGRVVAGLARMVRESLPIDVRRRRVKLNRKAGLEVSAWAGGRGGASPDVPIRGRLTPEERPREEASDS